MLTEGAPHLVVEIVALKAFRRARFHFRAAWSWAGVEGHLSLRLCFANGAVIKPVTKRLLVVDDRECGIPTSFSIELELMGY